MKIVVEIDEELYNEIKQQSVPLPHVDILCESVLNSTPLDDVKAEISEEICLTDNPYTGETKYTIDHLKLLDILDNICKQKEVRRNDK